MTQAEQFEFVATLVIVGFALCVFVITYRRYTKFQRDLFAHPGAIIISPPKSRFLFSWSVFFLIFYVPIVFLLRILKLPEEVFWVYVVEAPILWVFSAIYAYPRYSLSIYEYKLEGAPAWKWSWGRVEFDLCDIDSKKTARKNLFRRLGIVFFCSIAGEKILTFGLEDLQISQVLMTSKGTRIL